MNKIDIIQRLLDERHITAKEALVLMEKEYGSFQQWPYYPVIPYTPSIPYDPYPVYSTHGTYADTANLIINPN